MASNRKHHTAKRRRKPLTPTEIAALITAVSGLVTALATAAVQILNALK